MSTQKPIYRAWEAREARVYHKFTVFGEPSSRLICSCNSSCDYTSWDEQNSNARLIAAAPDLLAALKAMMVTESELRDVNCTVMQNAIAAIAKAEGNA